MQAGVVDTSVIGKPDQFDGDPMKYAELYTLCVARTFSDTFSLLLCRTVPDPKARVKRTSARAAESLATWPIPRTPQGMSPKSLTRLLLQTETRRLSTIRTTITSLLLKNHTREHWTVRCFHNVKSRCFCTFLIGDFVCQREEAKKACIGKPLLDREKEKVP